MQYYSRTDHTDGLVVDPRHRPKVSANLPWQGSVKIEEPAGRRFSILKATVHERRSSTTTLTLAVLSVFGLLSLGACHPVTRPPHSASPAPNPDDGLAHPLDDNQAMAQVVDPIKQIIGAAQLDGINAGFSFESCNDQGDPPYRGRVALTFLIHGDPDVYFEKVRNAMVTAGWNVGGLPGQVFHGTTLNRHGVTANITLLPSDHNYGQMLVHGQCRNTTDHHNDGKTNGDDITAQLQMR